MPVALIIVEALSRTTVPIRDPEAWDGQACATCGRRIEQEPAIYLVRGRVRCRRCVAAPLVPDGCLWCGKPGEMRDTGDRYCQACWTVYVAHISDMVEQPGPFRDLVDEAVAALADAAALTRGAALGLEHVEEEVGRARERADAAPEDQGHEDGGGPP